MWKLDFLENCMMSIDWYHMSIDCMLVFFLEILTMTIDWHRMSIDCMCVFLEETNYDNQLFGWINQLHWVFKRVLRIQWEKDIMPRD